MSDQNTKKRKFSDTELNDEEDYNVEIDEDDQSELEFEFDDIIADGLTDMKEELSSDKREKDYEIIPYEKLVKTQFAEIENISNTLGVTKAQSRLILRCYEWNSEKTLNTFFDKGKEFVFKVYV